MAGLFVAARDGGRCVDCDLPLFSGTAQASEHHRILGNRKDNRPSNGILLQGSGSHGCHWRWHVKDRPEAERRGYIVSRHLDPAATLLIPVWYNQPALGRVGWYLLDDTGHLAQVEWPEDGHAMDYMLERSGPDGPGSAGDDDGSREVPGGAAAAAAAAGPGPGRQPADPGDRSPGVGGRPGRPAGGGEPGRETRHAAGGSALYGVVARPPFASWEELEAAITEALPRLEVRVKLTGPMALKVVADDVAAALVQVLREENP